MRHRIALGNSAYSLRNIFNEHSKYESTYELYRMSSSDILNEFYWLNDFFFEEGKNDYIQHNSVSNMIEFVEEHPRKCIALKVMLSYFRDCWGFLMESYNAGYDYQQDIESDNASEVVPENAPEIMPENTPEIMPENTPEIMPENTPEVVPENAPEVVPENAPEVVHENAPEVMPENASEVVPENASEVMPENASEVVPENAPEVIYYITAPS